MNRLSYIGIAIAAIVIFAAIFAPYLATHSVTEQNLSIRFASPSGEFWFGTDALGRDIFSRILFGARISLQVGITVVLVSGVIGIFIGSIAGFRSEERRVGEEGRARWALYAVWDRHRAISSRA